MYLDTTANGSITLNFPDLEPWEMPKRGSCALDIAERGPQTLEYVGAAMNLTRERVRQLEVKALRKFHRNASAMKLVFPLTDETRATKGEGSNASPTRKRVVAVVTENPGIDRWQVLRLMSDDPGHRACASKLISRLVYDGRLRLEGGRLWLAEVP
jgi:hypothetical protein